MESFDPKKHKPIDTVGGMKATEYLASETSPEGTAWNIPTIWFDKDTKEPVFLGDWVNCESKVIKTGNFNYTGITNYYNARLGTQKELIGSRFSREIILSTINVKK